MPVLFAIINLEPLLYPENVLVLSVHSPPVCGDPFTTENVFVPSKFSEIKVDVKGVEGLASRVLELPLQMVEGVAVSADIVGRGFTRTIAVVATPVHPMPESELTVNVTVTGEEVVLVSDPLISAVPFDAIPIAAVVLFLDQE